MPAGNEIVSESLPDFDWTISAFCFFFSNPSLATFQKKLKNFVLKTARKDALRASTRLPAPCYDYADNDLQGTATGGGDKQSDSSGGKMFRPEAGFAIKTKTDGGAPKPQNPAFKNIN